jgi:hypothetical protein
MNSSNKTGSSPLYNSRIVDNYLKLLKRKYSFVNIGEVLNYADIKAYEVADQGHWFTQEQINRFQEKVQELTGNPNIDREAGRYAASPDAIGVMRQYILGLMGPAKVFELVSKVSGNFTRSADYKAKQISSNQVEVVVRMRENCQEKPFQCESRIGYFEAAAAIFSNKRLKIDHPECMFKGGDACRYLISWERGVSDYLRTARIFTSIAAIFAVAFYAVIDPRLAVTSILPLTVILILMLSMFIEKLEKNDLSEALVNLQGSTEKLVDQININYNNALMTNEVGQAISSQARMQIGEYVDSQTNIDNILHNVVHIFERRLDYKRGLVLLANHDRTKLELKAVFGYEDHMKLLEKVTFHLDRPESQGVFVVSFPGTKTLSDQRSGRD